MTTRIIPVMPVDAAAHVYRIAAGQIIEVFDQGTAGLLAVTWRSHTDGQGFTLANTPAGQVWVEVKSAVLGLGSLAALNSVDLSASSMRANRSADSAGPDDGFASCVHFGGAVLANNIRAGRLAQSVCYWPPFAESLAAKGSSDPMQVLITEVRELRAEVVKIVTKQHADSRAAFK